MKKSHFESPARIGFALILAVALQFTCARNGMAQESSAITGKVSDPSGAAAANATVTVKDVDRGTVWSTKTNTEGVYNLPRLPIGRYELRVEAAGFQKALRPAFSLELNQTTCCGQNRKQSAHSQAPGGRQRFLPSLTPNRRRALHHGIARGWVSTLAGNLRGTGCPQVGFHGSRIRQFSVARLPCRVNNPRSQ